MLNNRVQFWILWTLPGHCQSQSVKAECKLTLEWPQCSRFNKKKNCLMITDEITMTDTLQASSCIICSSGRTRGISNANLTLYYSLLDELNKKKKSWYKCIAYLIKIQLQRLTSHCGRPLHSSHVGRALILCQCLQCEPEHQQWESVLLREILN